MKADPDGLALAAGPRAVARRELLERSAISVGLIWAEERRAELHREGRAAAGAWPGTVREARVRMQRFLEGEVSRRRMSALTATERETAARAAYATARTAWSRQAEPEPPETTAAAGLVPRQ
jgi:hypothetical protein